MVQVTATSFNNPLRIICDPSGNLYVSDYSNNKIRKITPAGVVSTFAGTGAVGAAKGSALTSTFYGPLALRGMDQVTSISPTDLTIV